MLETYIFSDQTSTCPKCGARTEIILEKVYPIIYQHHKCPSNKCHFEFELVE